MKVDFMRFIDHRLGVPICFLLSCLHGIRRIFSKPKVIQNPESILFIELSEMGSKVLAYSLFQKTKELFPNAKLYFLTFKENRHAMDILGIFPEENVITVSSRSFFSFLFTVVGAIRKLRKRKIRVAVDMELFVRLTAILSYLSGAKNRVGYFRYHSEGLYRGNFLTHKVTFNPHIHMAQNLLNLIYAVTSPSGDQPLTKKILEESDIVIPKIQVADSDKEKMLKRLQEENANIRKAQKIILLNPNASDIVPLRRWPPENYIGLAKRLLEHKGVYLVITGVESEREPAEALQDAISSARCVNFAGKTSFFELVTLYSIAHILITNDSGPVHFSMMTEIKTFAFFGPETPKLFGPLGKNCRVFYTNYSCSPCISAFNHRKSSCTDNRCLQAITVEDVYAEVRKLLEGD